ncbi:MAG TPA: kelch repeat-containing protein, partial [Polyangium sp.]|nr:kelch repeat-containing protein [Polyangium sp.]
MRLPSLLPRAIFAAAFVGTTLGAGCGPEEHADTDLLERRFAEHARVILDAPGSFQVTSNGFVSAIIQNHTPAAEPAAQERVTLMLPQFGFDSIRFSLPSGHDIEVHEDLDAAAGIPVGKAIAYTRAGGKSYWVATADGYEEWLWLEKGVAQNDRVVATWRISRADVHQDGPAIVLDAEHGNAQIRVTAPVAYDIRGIPVEARLTARGDTIELRVNADGEEVLVDPAWQFVAPVSAVSAHTATRLADGRIFIGGGTYTSTGSIYDSATNTWTSTSSNGSFGARLWAGAILLPNGKVLIAGGDRGGGFGIVNTGQLYDPVTNTWTNTGNMSVSRAYTPLVLLQNGRVLTAGGLAPNTLGLTDAEIYDPATNTWTLVAPMGTARARHILVGLADGRVLAAGGHVGTTTSLTSTAEVYDPATNTWTPTGSLLSTRARYGAVGLRLLNGRVIMIGGTNANGQGWCDIWDPATGTWTTAAGLPFGRVDHAGAMLSNGQIIVAGGRPNTVPLNQTALYDPIANTWTSLPNLNTARYDNTATTLPSGDTVLVVGGKNSANADLSSVEL